MSSLQQRQPGSTPAEARSEAVAPKVGSALGSTANNAVAHLIKEDSRAYLYRQRTQSSRWLLADYRRNHDFRNLRRIEGNTYRDKASGETVEMDFKKLPRPATCSWSIGRTVTICTSEKRAHYGKLEHCSSIWACPVCSSVIRARRAEEIKKAVEIHQQGNGSIIFLTLTLRHQRKDPLALTLDTVLEGWRALMASRRWKSKTGIKATYGIRDYIRSVEITDGANGWHPHIHALLFLDVQVKKEALSFIGDEIFSFWESWVLKRVGRKPSRKHGIDLQLVDEKGKVVSEYLSKVQVVRKEKWGVEAELTRADKKKPKSRTPFDLLDRECPLPAGVRRARWLEYVRASKGRRCITWSRGMKDRYGISEKTDDELIEEESKGVQQWLTSAKQYRKIIRKPDVLVAVLRFAEVGDWKNVAEILPGIRMNGIYRPDS